jgi:hypothetical protein
VFDCNCHLNCNFFQFFPRDYYIHLIEAYLAIFPDGEEALMYDKPLRYFFSTATVKPRSEKYVLTLTYDGTDHHVQQLDATYFDEEKVEEQAAFFNQNTGLMGIEASWQRTEEGQPFMSSAIAKLFLLGSLKYATLMPGDVVLNTKVVVLDGWIV